MELAYGGSVIVQVAKEKLLTALRLRSGQVPEAKKGAKGRGEELLEAGRPVGKRIPPPPLRSASE